MVFKGVKLLKNLSPRLAAAAASWETTQRYPRVVNLVEIERDAAMAHDMFSAAVEHHNPYPVIPAHISDRRGVDALH